MGSEWQRAIVVSADSESGVILVSLTGYSGGGTYIVSTTGRAAAYDGTWAVPAIGSTIWVVIVDKMSHEVVWVNTGASHFGDGPRGVIAFGVSPLTTVVVPTTTAGVALTNNIEVALVADRRYRVVFQSRAVTPASGGTIVFRIDLRDGESVLADYYWEGSTAYSAMHAEFMLVGDDSTKNLRIYAVANAMATAATVYVDNNTSSAYYVEDVGPVT